MRPVGHFLPLCAGLLLAAPAPAQLLIDRLTPGRLGESLQLGFAGATPGKVLLVMPSLTAGPIPLAWFSPGDTRVLEVGFDLAPYWSTQGTGNGAGTVVIPTPLNPLLHGVGLRFQTLSAPGSPYLADQVSNWLRVQLGMPRQSAHTPDPLVAARGLGSAWLQKRNGRHEVLIAGGGQGSLLGAKGLDSSEVWSVDRMAAVAGPKLSAARALAVSVVLPDGRVLLAGGVDANGNALASAELYDPATHGFTPTGSMAVARAGHAGALLGNGRVIVGGGTNDLSSAAKALAGAQASCEIYDPSTGRWSNAPALGSRRLAPAFDSLANGRVLMSGGFEVILVFGIPFPIGSVATCQTFDPATGQWSNTGSMLSARGAHGPSTARLADGRIVASGGASSGPDLTQATPLAKVEAYSPASGTWSGLPDMPQARVAHSATPLGGNLLLFAGGARGTLDKPIALQAVDRLDAGTGQYTSFLPVPNPRAGHAALRLPDGAVALFGGTDDQGTLASVALIHP
jgi:hypothetical protein